MTFRKTVLLVLLPILLLALSLRLIGIGKPLFEREPSAWRQIYNEVTVQGYLHHGFKFFYPEVNFMGKPGYLVQEFPLYQYMVAWLYKFFGENIIWGRFLTIITSLGALTYLYFLLRRFLGGVPAAAGSLYFAIIPLSVYYGRTVMMDTSVLFLSLAFTYHFLSYLEGGRRWSIILAVVLSTLAMLIKFTIALVFLGPLLLLPLWLKKAAVYKKWEFYFFLCLPLITSYWWKSYADEVNLKYATITLQYTPQLLKNWVLGPLSMRWDREFYQTLFSRMIQQNLTWPGIFLAAGGIILSFIRSKLRVLLLYLSAGAGYLLTFTNLNFIHEHYQLPLIPIFAAFIGIFVDFAQGKIKALAQRKNILTPGKREKFLAPIVVILLGAFIFIPSIHELWKYSKKVDWEIIYTGKQIQQILPPEALVVAVNYSTFPRLRYPQAVVYNCNPVILYAVGRRGWNLYFNQFTLSKIESLKKEGAQYLVLSLDLYFPQDDKWWYMIMGDLQNNYKMIITSQRLIVFDLNTPPASLSQ